MGITAEVDEQGIAEVVMDNPPVNALTVAGWFDLAHQLRRAEASTPASTSRRCRRLKDMKP